MITLQTKKEMYFFGDLKDESYFILDEDKRHKDISYYKKLSDMAGAIGFNSRGEVYNHNPNEFDEIFLIPVKIVSADIKIVLKEI